MRRSPIMVSKAIASLDAWLARAEEVLAEQREHAISPSLGLSEGSGQYEWTTTLAALTDGLEGLLESVCRRPGRWILIVEHERRRHLFWQALAFEDGSVCTEAVSNHYLADEHHWSRRQQEQLLALGWEPPNPPKRPNFINVEATTSPDTDLLCQRALATLKEVFGLGDHDLVFVKMFSSAIRGDTPASPEYSPEEDALPLPEHAAVDNGIEGDLDDGDIFPSTPSLDEDECPTTSGENRGRDESSPVARHYFRPNIHGSDEELDAQIETWLEGFLGRPLQRGRGIEEAVNG
jgi:hypothetical protein